MQQPIRVLYYPEGCTDVGTPDDPNVRPNSDLADDILTEFRRTGVLVLPGTYDDDGERLWRLWQQPTQIQALQSCLPVIGCADGPEPDQSATIEPLTGVCITDDGADRRRSRVSLAFGVVNLVLWAVVACYLLRH